MKEGAGRCESGACQACRRVETICYMCSSECGIVAHEQGGEVRGVFGDAAHPMNHGEVCPKVFGALDINQHQDRIRTPLKRSGPRGEGSFVPISWEQALEEIAAKLVELKRLEGPETLLVQFGEKPDHDLVYRFANAYGTPNVLDHDSICDTNRREGFALTYGLRHFRPLPDLNRPLQTADGPRVAHDCRYLLLVGENPLEATRFLYLREGIRGALRAGMKLTVVDPYRTATASLAHDWLPARPGSDLALVLALLRFIIEHDNPADPARRYLDHDFLSRWTVGFEELKRFVLASQTELTPEWAEARTGIPAQTIRRVAHDFGSTKPAAAMVGMNGVGHHTNGFLTTRAVAMLVALTGNLDVPGGLCLAPRPALDTDRVHGTGLLSASRAQRHKDRYAGYPLASRGVKAKDPKDLLEGVTLTHGAHAGERYRLRSLFVIHGNPLSNAPGSGRWEQALTQRDETGEYALRLMVFNDTQLNDTGLYADYVLPMATFLERQGLCQIYVNEPTVSLRQPVLPPQYESRTPLGWVKPLAEACARAGDRELAGAIPYASDDEWCDQALAACPGTGDAPDGLAPDGAPLTVAWLRAHGGTASWPARYRKYEQLDTPSRKVELVSERILAANREFGTAYEGLLRYESCRWNPEHPDFARYGAEYPFQLITGRALGHTGAFTQNLPRMLHRSPAVLLCAGDAARLGVKPGDWVRLRNPLGAQVVAQVDVTDGLRSGVVRATHGWGQRSPFLSGARGRGYNVNRLTDDEAFNALSGNAALGDMMVAIEFSEAPAAASPPLPPAGPARPEPGPGGGSGGSPDGR